MAGGFSKGAAAVSTLGTLAQMGVGAGLLVGATLGVGQLEKAMNAAGEANSQPQQAAPPPTADELARRQRLAAQQEWLQQQGGFSGLNQTLAEGGQPAAWDSGWQRTLQARGQLNK